jgi:putative flippase GtrA
MWWRIPQQMRFLLAGGFNTIFGYLVFGLLYLSLANRLHYLEIGVLSQAIAVTSAFVIYRHLVFRSSEPWPRSFIRFNVSQLAAFALGLVGLYGTVHFGHLPPLIAQAIVIFLTVIVSYTLHRFYSFRRGMKSDAV